MYIVILVLGLVLKIVALRSCTSTDGLYKRFPVLKDTLDKCFADVNEEIANASN